MMGLHSIQRMCFWHVLAITLIGIAQVSHAEEISVSPPIQEAPKESAVTVTGGVTGWLMTQGQTRWSHDFSRLTYKDDSTHIGEVSGQVTFRKRWFVRGDVGYGGIERGSLVDDDFNGANGPLASRTTSGITGNTLWYVNGDVGAIPLQFRNGRGGVAFFTGFQYWHQEHQAIDVVQNVCDPLSGFCNPASIGQNLALGQRAITNTATWMSWRLGVDANYHLTRKLVLNGKVVFMPVSSLKNDDIHHLRLTNVPTPGGFIPALSQDPSFRMTGLGMGTDLEASAAYMILPRLALSVGYRFWWNWVHDGTVTQYTRDFGAGSVDLNSFQSYRHGVTVGLRYTF